VKPPVIPDPGGKSNFIAAARRAAQAAAAQVPQATKAEPAAAEPAQDGLAQSLAGRVRTLLVGASVVVIVLGTLHYGASLLGFYETGPTLPPPVASADPAANRAKPAQTSQLPPAQPVAPANDNGSTRQSGVLPGTEILGAGAPPSGVVMPEDKPAPAVTGPRTEAPPPADVTGAIAKVASAQEPPAVSVAAPLPIAPAAILGNKLPAGIGGPALRSAAATGDPTAAYEIGVRFAEGRGVSQSFEEAARWFERAAKDGITPAHFRIGGLYEKGLGLKKDLQTARRHYLAAAEKGHGKAMHNLAVLYAEGIDGRPDYKTAAQWFRKAAHYGIADSQYNLGVLYARGIGVEQNLAESYKWFTLAAQQGDQESGRKRDEIATRMNTQALNAARLAAQTFKPDAQPEAAVNVPTPPGGWDRATAAAAKPRSAARP
jgi:localization factor PodJL